MFVILRLMPKTKLRLYLHAEQKCWNGINFYEVFASTPRNSKQWKKLNLLLMPADNTIVLPNGFFNNKLTVSAFSIQPFCDKLLLQAFLKYCKNKKPAEVCIRPNGKLTNSYLLAICRYVGRLIILDTPKDTEFCRLALEESGTPIIYSSSAITDIPCLDLGGTHRILPSGSVCFSDMIFRFLTPPVLPFPDFFADLNQLCLSAAIDAQIKNHSTLQDAWIEVILNNY